MECLQEISVDRLRKANCVIIGKIPLEKTHNSVFSRPWHGSQTGHAKKKTLNKWRGPLCKIEELNPHVKKKVVRKKKKQRLKLGKENMAKNIKRSQEIKKRKKGQ
jgi:hypothetical protein